MAKNTVQAVGARASITIGEETVFGEGVDTTHLIPFTSEGLSADEDTLESEAIRGDRGKSDLIQGTLEVGGDLSFEQSASGFGMIIRHALGDYIKAERVDGGVHGRVEAVGAAGAPLSVGLDEDNLLILPLAKEHAGGFLAADGKFVLIDRDDDTNKSLRLQGDQGIAYDSYAPSSMSHVAEVGGAPEEPPNAMLGVGIEVETVTVFPERAPDGTYRRPAFNPNGGLVEYGHQRDTALYIAAEDADVTISGTLRECVKLYMAPDVGAGDISAGDFIFGHAGFAKVATGTTFVDGAAGEPELKRGAWVLEYETEADDLEGVFTHFMERGRYLPEGLTIEIDRDAAIFLYTGCKVDSLNWNFDTNAIVDATASVVGQSEFAMARLAEDVIPGVDDGNSADYILVTNAEAFPDPNTHPAIEYGIITIGERTDIRYDEKVKAGPSDGRGYSADDGVYKLVLIDKTEVDTFHPVGTNVDCRTSRRIAEPYEGNNTPLTSFESVVFIDGVYEEVLSADVTLENNVNTDKFGLGSRKVLAVVAEEAEVTATLSMEFDDGKHYNRFRGGDFFFLELKCLSEAHDAEIGRTGVPAQQYVILPRCKYDGETPDVADRSFIEHDMPVTATPDRDYGNSDLVVILVNGNEHDVEAA